MRDWQIFPYFFPYAVTIIRTYWYLMQKSGIELGNNDTKSGILTTYGIIPCNSNPSSSAKNTQPHLWLGVFYLMGLRTGWMRCALSAAGDGLTKLNID